MKKSLTIGAVLALSCVAVAWAVRAQTLGGTTSVTLPDSVLAILNAVPPPADDPLLDSNGNVVYDSSGQPVSDPNEQFHQVKPTQFDPARTYLVQAAWLNGTGCPTNAVVATYPSTSPTGQFSACATGDPGDQHNEGLLLAKTGPTTNNASAVAELKKVRGTMVFELGYDIRKEASILNPAGSHCGAGAPRFLIIYTDGTARVLACNSPAPDEETPMEPGWIRLRWRATAASSTPVQRILIIFDEGQDTGPDNFGAAFLDNIDVNGEIVGAGPTDAR